MREFYEPVLNLSDPEHHSIMGAFLTLKEPVDGDILRSAVDALRMRFPYFHVRAAYKGEDEACVSNDLPMTVRNSWEPISFNTEAANFHLKESDSRFLPPGLRSGPRQDRFLPEAPRITAHAVLQDVRRHAECDRFRYAGKSRQAS